MIVGFVLILSIVGISLATALYSNFLPYFSLLSDVKNYNMAYYGANTAIERSFSVLRYQEAGFEGTGGRNKVIGDIIDSPLSDKGGFGYYDSTTTTLQRSIIGRPDSNLMPGTGKGNTDLYLLSGVSNDWNKLDYRRPQQIPLGVDDTSSDQAYIENNDHSISDSSNVMLHLQLIPSVKEKFTDSDPISWKLNDNIDGDGDGIGNDVIVDRGWKGLYDTGSEFSILPRSLVGSETETGDIVSLSDDESIREDTINKLVSNLSTIPITFGENFNPLYDNSNSPDNIKPSQKDSHLMISDDSATTSGISLKDFKNLLLDPTINKQELNFFLTRHLISNGGGIYPFLQYKIEFDGNLEKISQPYFTINGKSQVGNYTVQMNVKKSINKNETLGSFTVVF